MARDDETLLVFSTLGGGLTAVDPITSEVRWSIDDGGYLIYLLCTLYIGHHKSADIFLKVGALYMRVARVYLMS